MSTTPSFCLCVLISFFRNSLLLIYLHVFYTLQSAAAPAAGALCCYTAAVAAAVAAVHRVPDGKNVADSLNLITSSVFFLFIQTRIIFNACTYAVLSHLGSRLACTASSVIAGMRRAKAGVSPPRGSTPSILYQVLYYRTCMYFRQ